MIGPQTLVFLWIGASLLLILVVMARPSITVSREGEIFAFLALFIVPVPVIAAGVGARRSTWNARKRRNSANPVPVSPKSGETRTRGRENRPARKTPASSRLWLALRDGA